MSSVNELSKASDVYFSEPDFLEPYTQELDFSGPDLRNLFQKNLFQKDLFQKTWILMQ